MQHATPALGPSCTESCIVAAPMCFGNAKSKGNLLSAHLLIRYLLNYSQDAKANVCT